MRLIGLAVVLVIGLSLVPVAAETQQARKVYRIGVLREGEDVGARSLEDAMRKAGWVEGQNLKIERRHADGPDKLSALAAELVGLKVDVILTNGTPATLAAKAATKTIPIVFMLGADPVATGLVASFARPGGNITGFATGLLNAKLLEVLKEAAPRVSRVAFPASPGGLSHADLSAAARALRLEVTGIAVNGPEDFDGFLAAAKRLADGAALVPNVAWFIPHLELLGAATAKNHILAIGPFRQFAKAGGLLSYGATLGQSFPRVVTQIDKILKGANPGDSPIEQPTKFELVINLKTAKALGLTIPQSLLVRADEIIQ